MGLLEAFLWLLLAEVELNLVQIEIYKFHLLNKRVHQTTALLGRLLPKLDHFAKALAQGDKFGEGGSPSHLDVIALGR